MPSESPADLLHNAGLLDTFANGAASAFTDRLGNSRKTVAGFEVDQAAALAAFAAQSGYSAPVAYTSGLAMTVASQTVTYSGNTFAPIASFLPFTTSGTFETAKFRIVVGVSVADMAATSGSSFVGYDGGTVQDVLDTAKPMQSYTALRAYMGRATHVRITTPGIAGFFQRNGSAADNGGTVIVDGSGRSWERVFDGAVNVKWFGAVGDGVANDTAAIQAAINTSSAIDASTGTYLVDSLDIPSGKHIFGAGKDASVFVAASGSVSNTVSASSHVVIKDLGFSGFANAFLPTSVSLDSFEISGCKFTDCQRVVADRTDETTTINAAKTISNFRYIDNEDTGSSRTLSLLCLVHKADVLFNTTVDVSHTSKAWAYGVGSEDGTNTVYNSYGVNICHNYVNGVESSALNAESHGVFMFAKQSLVEANEIRNVTNTNASSINGTEGIYCKAPDSRITGNTLIDAGMTQGSICAKSKSSGMTTIDNNRIFYENASVLSGTGLTGIYASEQNRANIRLNKVYNAQTGIRVATTASATPENITIIDNEIEGDLYAGILSTVCDRLVVAGNTITQVSSVSALNKAGVVLTVSEGLADIVDISRNNTGGVKVGVETTTSGAGAINKLRLTDNVLTTDVSIAGNRGVTYSGTIGELFLSGNDVSRPTNAIVGTPPSVYVLGNNLGFSPITNVAAYDPPSLANGGAINTTLTATGAAVGDYVQVSYSVNLNGVGIVAWVSSANTVTVRFTNNTGGTVDLATGNIKVRVTKS